MNIITWKRLPLFLMIIGIIIVVTAIAGYFTGRIPSSYKRTMGTVVSLKTVNVYSGGVAGHENPTTYPTIEFTVNNITYHMTGSGNTNPAIGQKISVSYNPTNPSTSPRLTADKGSQIFAVVGTIFGLTMGFLSLILRRKQTSV